MPRIFESPNGYVILVGKNRRDNTLMTSKIGRPHDFWMHVANTTGAHVIMQWNPEDLLGPQRADFEYAVHLAAYYSKARHEVFVPVKVCRVCDVRKPTMFMMYGQPNHVSTHGTSVDPPVYG